MSRSCSASTAARSTTTRFAPIAVSSSSARFLSRASASSSSARCSLVSARRASRAAIRGLRVSSRLASSGSSRFTATRSAFIVAMSDWTSARSSFWPLIETSEASVSTILPRSRPIESRSSPARFVATATSFSSGSSLRVSSASSASSAAQARTWTAAASLRSVRTRISSLSAACTCAVCWPRSSSISDICSRARASAGCSSASAVTAARPSVTRWRLREVCNDAWRVSRTASSRLERRTPNSAVATYLTSPARPRLRRRAAPERRRAPDEWRCEPPAVVASGPSVGSPRSNVTVSGAPVAGTPGSVRIPLMLATGTRTASTRVARSASNSPTGTPGRCGALRSARPCGSRVPDSSSSTSSPGRVSSRATLGR